MANILNIETSGKQASLCVSGEEKALAMRSSTSLQEHAAWLHVAIREAMAEAGLEMSDLNAVAVSIGPGSYTGLRLGMAAAKGICFALNIPLLCIPTLQIMALAAREETKADFYCPMIDARRMEVFTAVYNNELQEVQAPSAVILEPGIMDHWLTKGIILFSGDGAHKAQPLILSANALFTTIGPTASVMKKLSLDQFRLHRQTDLAYSEPFYLKEFYTPNN